jgi:solute carrier family 25 oxoglutarate transporter 11
MRQVVYGTLRLGIYFNMIEYYKKKNGAETTTFTQKAQASLLAGCLGSFIGNPADLSLIRLQADSTMPPEDRRNYKGVFDAISRISSEEGVTALWKGAVPTMTRACSLNIAMMVSYDTAREQLEARLGKDRKYTVAMSASMVSACCTAFFSLPFDNMKTKIQK